MLEGSRQVLLAEECLVVGFTGSPADPLWLEPEEAVDLLQRSQPVDDVPLGLKRMEIEEVLGRLGEVQGELEFLAQQRSRVC